MPGCDYEEFGWGWPYSRPRALTPRVSITCHRGTAGGVWRFRDSDNYYLCRANALENNVVLNGEQLFDDFWFGK